jgi:hypothetical protein
MTRQQLRANKRRAAKSNIVDDIMIEQIGELQCFGAYYKGDTDEGFGFSWSEITSPGVDMDEVRRWSEIVSGNTKRILDIIDKGDVTKKDMIDDAWIAIKEHIKTFNLDTFGQETQPINGTPMGKCNIMLGLEVFCDIHFLQEMGEIECDSQNGMHYMYSRDSLLA